MLIADDIFIGPQQVTTCIKLINSLTTKHTINTNHPVWNKRRKEKMRVITKLWRILIRWENPPLKRILPPAFLRHSRLMLRSLACYKGFNFLLSLTLSPLVSGKQMIERLLQLIPKHSKCLYCDFPVQYERCIQMCAEKSSPVVLEIPQRF